MTSILSIRDLELSRDGRPILRGLSLEVARGEVCVLTGASGAGKSTVLRCIAALEPFNAGTIRVDIVELAAGRVPRQSALAELRRRVAMVFQSHALFEHLSAIDNVMLAPRHVLGWPVEQARTRAVELLTAVDVIARADAFPRQLSGGEAQRVAIARALIGDPMLLLMDEPTSALDPARRGALAATLRQLAKNGRAILIATHDMDFAGAVADRRIMLRDGKVESSPEGIAI